MVNTIVDGTLRQTNLTNESSEYLAKREELRLAEIELMRQRERVAELRRHLPQGAPIQDYAFEEGPRDLNGGDAPVALPVGITQGTDVSIHAHSKVLRAEERREDDTTHTGVAAVIEGIESIRAEPALS